MIRKLHEVSLASVFSEEVLAICECLANLAIRLRQLGVHLPNDEAKKAIKYANYFEAMRQAIAVHDLSIAEMMWRNLDQVWLEIGPDMMVMPVHMMENGYHHPVAVTPEFRILWRSKELASEIAALYGAVALLGKEAGDDLLADKLARTDADAFILVAGGNYDFRIAGQSVPNRPEIQKKGMKAILDPETLCRRQARFENLLGKCVGAKTLEWLKPHFSLLVHILAVVGHEIGHPVLVNEQVNQTFDADKPMFEETKATLIGLMAMLKIQDSIPGPARPGPALAAYLLGEVSRRFDKNSAADVTMRPYYNEAKTIATCLLRAEVLEIEGGKLELNPRVGQGLVVLLACLQEPYSKLLSAYRSAFFGVEGVEVAEGEKHPVLAAALEVVNEFAPDPLSPELAELSRVINANLYPVP